MASSSKRKTTMAKLNRERKLLERRQEKQARKVRAEASGRTRGRQTTSRCLRRTDEQPTRPLGLELLARLVEPAVVGVEYMLGKPGV